MDNINKEIDSYIRELKNKVKQIHDLDEIKEFIDKYEVLKINNKCDNKCEAFTSNGKQCSRKKKGLGKLCGIHEVSTENKDKSNQIERINIQGIFYYIDKIGNVYSPKDMIEGNEIKIGTVKTCSI